LHCPRTTHARAEDVHCVCRIVLHFCDPPPCLKPGQRPIVAIYAETSSCDVLDSHTACQLHAPPELVLEGLKHEFYTLLAVVLLELSDLCPTTCQAGKKDDDNIPQDPRSLDDQPSSIPRPEPEP
jgi:hypothetical protein